MSYQFDKRDLMEDIEMLDEEVRRMDDLVAGLYDIDRWMNDVIDGRICEKDDVEAKICLRKLQNYLLKWTIYRRECLRDALEKYLEM